jgi:CubicO group peptidase (beta-lactamase class C family)
MAVMMLAEEGKLRLDDPLTRYFPKAPAIWSGITVRHLLTHSGGIQNHVAVPGYLRIFKTDLFFEGTPARDELLARFFELPQEFAAGETWAYDNTGYILLGWIVEQASGRSYWDFVQERILGPLGMAATRSTDPRPIVEGRAAGYGWTGKGLENRPVLAPFVAFSAGSLLSTVGDLAKWDAALYGDRLLGQPARDRLWTAAPARDGSPASYDYGFGWFVDSYHGHRLVQHSGGTPGFSSAIYRFVDDGLTVIVLTNHADIMLDALALDIAGLYEPALKRPESASDPDPGTTARLRSVFSALLAGRHDPADFTRPMQVFLATATGRAFWQWFAEHGALQSFQYSSGEERGGLRVLRYGVVLGGIRHWYTVKLAPDGKIAQITWW